MIKLVAMVMIDALIAFNRFTGTVVTKAPTRYTKILIMPLISLTVGKLSCLTWSQLKRTDAGYSTLAQTLMFKLVILQGSNALANMIVRYGYGLFWFVVVYAPAVW
jgi:hypothetical protein